MWAYFGLSDRYVESSYEIMFLMKYHGGFSITEYYNLPIGLRDWFVKKLRDQKELEKDAIEEASGS